jgi:phenylalanyl-tRNA synthetase beta chain
VVEYGTHPDSEHLHVLKVSTGAETLDIVCGAPNARKGLKGVLARPGDIIPESGEKLKKSKIRGVESQGMMCSERELGLGQNHEGIIELPANAKAGDAAAKYLDLDVIYDAEVTPNRPDLLGIAGIARDMAAGGMGEFVPPAMRKVSGSFDCPIKVRNETPDTAPYFNVRYIRGVKNSASPAWLAQFLSIYGKSISALVDITNYCLYSYCRPLHAFDADKIKGDVVIRKAKEGEKFLGLDGKEYILAAGDTAICDDTGVISLAGIMGGASTASDMNTRNILLESAYFDPGAIRRSAKRLGIETDSKYRFERGIDPASCEPGLDEATAMAIELCGGEASRIVSTGANPLMPATIDFPAAYFARRIGVEMPVRRMCEILAGLGCAASVKGESLLITPPSWRPDLAAKEDITEELIRVEGMDKIPLVPIECNNMSPVIPAEFAREARARRALAGRGLLEIDTWSFMSSAKELDAKEPIRVSNPITSDLDALRQSLVPNLLDALSSNIARSTKNLGMFEIAPAFLGGKPGEQREHAAAVRTGQADAQSWWIKAREYDIYDIKADLMALLSLYGIGEEKLKFDTQGIPPWANPRASAKVMLKGAQIALFGEVHPSALKKFGIKQGVAFFECNLDALPPAKRERTQKRPAALSEYQSTPREFSIVVDASTPIKQIYDAIAALNDKNITDITIFDIYGMGEKKAVGVSLALQAQDKTLSDAEIVRSFEGAIAAVEKTGGELRK